MDVLRFSMIAVFVFLCVVVDVEAALEDPPSTITEGSDFANTMLHHHNYYRVTGAGLNALGWNQDLADYAFEYAAVLKTKCLIEHSDQSDSGENLYIWSTGAASLPDTIDDKANTSVKNWYKEIRDFLYYPDEGMIFCSKRLDDGAMIGHFTAMMSYVVTDVGCAYTTCVDGNKKKIIINCNYLPYPNMANREVFNSSVAQRLNCWPYNEQYGGLPKCDYDTRLAPTVREPCMPGDYPEPGTPDTTADTADNSPPSVGATVVTPVTTNAPLNGSVSSVPTETPEKEGDNTRVAIFPAMLTMVTCLLVFLQ